jgi:hypothetical protein
MHAENSMPVHTTLANYYAYNIERIYKYIFYLLHACMLAA